MNQQRSLRLLFVGNVEFPLILHFDADGAEGSSGNSPAGPVSRRAQNLPPMYQPMYQKRPERIPNAMATVVRNQLLIVLSILEVSP